MEFLDRTETTRYAIGTHTVTLTDQFKDQIEITVETICIAKTYEYQAAPGSSCKEQISGFFEFIGPVEDTQEALGEVDAMIFCDEAPRDPITVTGTKEGNRFTAHGYAHRREGNRIVIRCENTDMQLRD